MTTTLLDREGALEIATSAVEPCGPNCYKCRAAVNRVANALLEERTKRGYEERFCIGCGEIQTEREREFDLGCPCGGGFMTAAGAVRYILSREAEAAEAARRATPPET